MFYSKEELNSLKVKDIAENEVYVQLLSDLIAKKGKTAQVAMLAEHSVGGGIADKVFVQVRRLRSDLLQRCARVPCKLNSTATAGLCRCTTLNWTRVVCSRCLPIKAWASFCSTRVRRRTWSHQRRFAVNLNAHIVCTSSL